MFSILFARCLKLLSSSRQPSLVWTSSLCSILRKSFIRPFQQNRVYMSNRHPLNFFLNICLLSTTCMHWFSSPASFGIGPFTIATAGHSKNPLHCFLRAYKKDRFLSDWGYSLWLFIAFYEKPHPITASFNWLSYFASFSRLSVFIPSMVSPDGTTARRKQNIWKLKQSTLLKKIEIL